MKVTSIIQLIIGAFIAAILFLWTGNQGESSPPPVYQKFDLTLPLVDGSVRFAVMGSADPAPRLQYETLKALKDVYKGFPFRFILMVGDDDRGKPASNPEKHRLSRLLQDLSSFGVEFYPSPGSYSEWREASGVVSEENGSYYTFQKGPVRFFALDSDKLDQQQLNWFEERLRDSGELWRACFLERPLLMKSENDSTRDADLQRQLLESLFVKYQVHVVFSGRGHPYKRLHPRKGTYHFISGASVIPANGLDLQEDLIASDFDRDLSFLLVEISGDVLYFQSISRRGETIDRSALPRLHPEKWKAEQ